MSKTTFTAKDAFLLETSKAVANLKEKLQKVDIAITETGGVLNRETYHFVTRILKPHNRVERTIYSLIYKQAYQTEMMSAGSGYLSVVLSVVILEKLLKERHTLDFQNETSLVEAYQRGAGEMLKAVSLLSVRSTKDDIKKFVEDICQQDKDLSVAIRESIDLAGLEGNVRIEQGKQAGYVVELKHGYNFELDPYKFFLSPDTNTWEATEVKVLLMDGLLERVSEIEQLLNGCIASKQALLIVAQGFSEEVVATLKLNTDRGVFNIIPVRLQPDLEGLNILNDIAAATGGDVVSALKGDLLMFKTFDSLPVVDSVSINIETTSIQNNKTRGNVGAQIKMLLEKRTQANVIEDISTLLDKRITSLLSHAVVLKLPNMAETTEQNTRVKIDICLRTVKTLVGYGTIDFNKLVDFYKDDRWYGEVLRETRSYLKEFKLPTLTVGASLYFSGQNMLAIMSSAGLVEVDQ